MAEVHVVVGMGEVGSAIKETLTWPDQGWGIEHEVWPRDLEPTPFRPDHTDFLHICIPYTEDFVRQVKIYQADYLPRITVIHSSVPPGTSRSLHAVHSPVLGQHATMAADLRTYRKIFTAQDPDDAEAAASSFARCNIGTAVFSTPESTEAGKLLQTLYYGWLIAFQKLAKEYCELVGARYEVAYHLMNALYNEGMAAKNRALRLPSLEDMPGPIGGHCVIPNAALIAAQHPLALSLIQFNGRWIDLALDFDFDQSKVSSQA